MRKLLTLVALLVLVLAAAMLPVSADAKIPCSSFTGCTYFVGSQTSQYQFPAFVIGTRGYRPEATVEFAAGIKGDMSPTDKFKVNFSFKVTSGPDAGQSSRTISAESLILLSEADGFWSFANTGGVGVDTVAVTAKFEGHTEHATTQVAWIEPVPCDGIYGMLGAFECAKRTAGYIVHGVECAGAIGTLIGAPETRLLDAFRDAVTVIKAKRDLGDARDAGKLATLAADVHSMLTGARMKILLAQLKQDKNQGEFIATLFNMVQSAAKGKIGQVAIDIASIAGFGSCVDLLEDSVTDQTDVTPTEAAGTGSPPSVLGYYTMRPFDTDTSDDGADVSSVTGPTGAITFDNPVEHLLATEDWATWSNGYTGDVYSTDYETGGQYEVTITLPPNTGAFYLYAEPDDFETFSMVASADGSGHLTDTDVTDGPTSVYGNSGAQFFGFYARCGVQLKSITVTDDGSDGDMAFGEFGIAPSC